MFKRNYFQEAKENRQAYKSFATKDENGYTHVAIFSFLFSNMSKTLVGTNSMYNELKNDIRPCVEGFSHREKVMVDVFETTDSDEYSRQVAISGFRRYMGSICYGKKNTIIKRFLLFFSIMLLGVFIEFALYGLVDEVNSNFPLWVFKSIEVLATLFIWQFVGYMTFEFRSELISYKRDCQIGKSEFNFKHFE